MSEGYIGEIRWFPYVRGAPLNWLLCDGSRLPISNYETLYTLIGTIYGGDGRTDFALPDLRGRVPVHQGQGTGLSPRTIGMKGGFESVSLIASQAGGHSHALNALTTKAQTPDPAGALFAVPPTPSESIYIIGAPGLQVTPLAGPTIGSRGQGLPHENCAPTLPLLACICTAGVFPSQQ